MKKILLSAAIASTLLLSGCQTTPSYVDTATDQTVVLGLSYKDFENAADKAIHEITSSPALVHPQAAQGGRYVLAISNIINDTTQRIDTDQLVKKIRVGLLQSGKFLTTTAISANGMEDNMTKNVRDMADSSIVNKSTAKTKAGVILPDFSLSGKIIQRNHRIDNSNQQIEYYFQLTLTNLENGLAYYESEYPIIKRGDNDTVSW